MPSQINVACTSCDKCRPTCPTGAITPGSRTYVVDADVCTECLLCVPICPVEAIENPLVPKKKKKTK